MTGPRTPTEALRQRPTEAWISAQRERFPVEPTIDEVFTHKLRKRMAATEHSLDFGGLDLRLQEFLSAQTGQPELRVEALERLSGGASKEQFSFWLHWRPEGAEHPVRQRMMLRMDPTEAIVETHRRREWEVLRAVHGRVPVPEALWLDPEGRALGRPALIAGFLDGTVRPPGADRMSGVGM